MLELKLGLGSPCRCRVRRGARELVPEDRANDLHGQALNVGLEPLHRGGHLGAGVWLRHEAGSIVEA
jgi:hypothetical protein